MALLYICYFILWAHSVTLSPILDKIRPFQHSVTPNVFFPLYAFRAQSNDPQPWGPSQTLVLRKHRPHAPLLLAENWVGLQYSKGHRSIKLYICTIAPVVKYRRLSRYMIIIEIHSFIFIYVMFKIISMHGHSTRYKT